jgi:branched-chain amino acid transport system permease protein
MAYLAPKVALASTVLLMVAVLMWRPGGLFSQEKG